MPLSRLVCDKHHFYKFAVLSSALFFGALSQHYMEPIFYLLKLNSLQSYEAAIWALLSLAFTFTADRVSQRYKYEVLASLFLSLILIGVGVQNTLATSFFWAGIGAIGVVVLLCLGRFSQSLSVPPLALPVGAAVWLVLAALIIHFPVNYRWVYITILIAFILFAVRLSRRTHLNVIEGFSVWCEWIREIPYWFWALGLSVIGWVMRYTWFPSLFYDDHALHLRLWTELSLYAKAQFDVVSQIWAVAPFSVDIIHATVSMLAGEDARGALNLSFVFFLLLVLLRIGSLLRLQPRNVWLLVVLFFSTPMTANMLLTLQTELALALVCTAAVMYVLQNRGYWFDIQTLPFLACVALAASIKLPGAVLGIFLLIAFALTILVASRKRDDTQQSVEVDTLTVNIPFMAVVLVFLLCSLQSYIVAFVLTGNPLFPLYNEIFQSEFFPLENFSDPTWGQGLSLARFVEAFFYTSRFMESGDYTAGWQYLLVFPILFYWLLSKTKPLAFGLLLVPVLGFGMVMFGLIHYWRYLFPIMPLAGLFIGFGFALSYQSIKRGLLVAIVLCISANLYFMNDISWHTATLAGRTFSSEGKDRVVAKNAPAVAVTNQLNALSDGRTVLYPPEMPFGATLLGQPVYLNWYSPRRSEKYAAFKSIEDVKQFVSAERVDIILFNISHTSLSTNYGSYVREYLNRFGDPIVRVGPIAGYQIKNESNVYTEFFNLQTHLLSRAVANNALEQENRPELPLSSSSGKLLADLTPRIIETLQIKDLSQIRYDVVFNCQSPKEGYFVAQVNWDVGEPYYRLVDCQEGEQHFAESVPVPEEASSASVYITSRQTNAIEIGNITLGRLRD